MRKQILIILVFMILMLFSIVYAQTILVFSDTVSFKLGAYNTKVTFSNGISCYGWTWVYDNYYFNTTIIYINFSNYGYWGFKILNGNVTFTDFFNTNDYTIKCTVEASSGTWSYLYIYYPNDYPKYFDVQIGSLTERIKEQEYFRDYQSFLNYPYTSLYLNVSGKYVILKSKHQSPVLYTIYFVNPPPEISGGGPIGGPILQPTPKPIYQPPPTFAFPPEAGTIVIIGTIAFGLILYVAKRERKDMYNVLARRFKSPINFDKINEHLRKRWRS